MDIEKAFDKVWHEGLLYKMVKLHFPKWQTKLIKSYLHQREFEVTINNETSTTKQITAGVPQDSVLGPILFNVYIADLPELKYCKVAQFADDTTIFTHHRNKISLHKRLQADVDKIYNWFQDWKIKVN